MYVRGDMLVYGYSNFQWTFLKDLRDSSRDELIGIMKNHIVQVMSHFKGKVNLWPVVNESRNPTELAEEGEPYDMFGAIIGADYVDIAFETARKADPSATLIYNECRNEQSKGSHGRLTQSTRDIVNRLKSKGLIDGVGIQMHLDGSQPPDIDDLIQTLKSYGMPIYLTEFDVDMSKVPGTSEEKNRIQAQIYKNVFKACVDLGVCRDVYFWETGDKYSWPGGTATMYDDDLKPKPAYFAIRKVLLEKLAQK
jgi:endo-1,4-beta-xylanase